MLIGKKLVSKIVNKYIGTNNKSHCIPKCIIVQLVFDRLSDWIVTVLGQIKLQWVSDLMSQV